MESLHELINEKIEARKLKRREENNAVAELTSPSSEFMDDDDNATNDNNDDSQLIEVEINEDDGKQQFRRITKQSTEAERHPTQEEQDNEVEELQEYADNEELLEQEVEFSVGATEKMKKALWYQGFRFLNNNKSTRTMYWRCDQFRTSGCRVTASTPIDNFEIGKIFPSRYAEEHNHMAKPWGVEVEMRMAEFRRKIVQQPNVPASKLIEELKEGQVHSNEFHANLPSDKVLKHYVARRRRLFGFGSGSTKGQRVSRLLQNRPKLEVVRGGQPQRQMQNRDIKVKIQANLFDTPNIGNKSAGAKAALNQMPTMPLENDQHVQEQQWHNNDDELQQQPQAYQYQQPSPVKFLDRQNRFDVAKRSQLLDWELKIKKQEWEIKKQEWELNEQRKEFMALQILQLKNQLNVQQPRQQQQRNQHQPAQHQHNNTTQGIMMMDMDGGGMCSGGQYGGGGLPVGMNIVVRR